MHCDLQGGRGPLDKKGSETMRTTIFLALFLTGSLLQAAEMRTVTIADLPKTLAQLEELGHTVIAVLPLVYKVESTCEPQPTPGCYPVDPADPQSPIICVDPAFTPAQPPCETLQVLESVTVISQSPVGDRLDTAPASD